MDLPKLGKVTGHSTRSIAPSVAEFKNAAIEDILRVADWSSAKTFYKYYWKRMTRSTVNNAVLSSVSDNP